MVILYYTKKHWDRVHMAANFECSSRLSLLLGYSDLSGQLHFQALHFQAETANGRIQQLWHS